MSPQGPVFQFFRSGGDPLIWWRMISPNGRRIAQLVTGQQTLTSAQASLAAVLVKLHELEPLITSIAAERPPSRWRWNLCIEGIPVVRGAVEHDRRVRCEMAMHRFMDEAPRAVIDPALYSFAHGARAVAVATVRPAFTDRRGTGRLGGVRSDVDDRSAAIERRSPMAGRAGGEA